MDIESNTVAYDVYDVIVAHAGRHEMQCESSVLVYDRMACVRAALKSNDDIRIVSEKIRDLTLTLVAPVGANYRGYHINSSNGIKMTDLL